MKVFSLLQPWATLWVSGAKLLETRAFGTSYCGVVAVHASLGLPEENRRLCYESPFVEALAELGYSCASELPRGKLLGTVVVTGCLRMVDEPVTGAPALERYISLLDDPRLTERERAFGNYMAGRWAWVTAPAPRVVLGEPIAFKGSLGLRELPWDIAERVARAPGPPTLAGSVA